MREELAAGDVPLWVHPEWRERFPWLVQGTTGAGTGEEPFDLGLWGDGAVGATMERWARLREAVGISAATHARQVHGDRICEHPRPPTAGLLVLHGFDGHLVREPGLLLTVSVADCVPVFLVDAGQRAVAAVHAGWRGVAAEIVEQGLERLAPDRAAREQVWVHCGPAICGLCYQVGPEVHRAVNPAQAPPAAATPIDLRAAIAARVAARGVAWERITVSGHCTRCGPGAFFSHRGGSPARQMGVLGRRE